MRTTDINDFLIRDDEVILPEELDYSMVTEYISTAEAFYRSSCRTIYIIDYFRQKFLYVSPDATSLGGISPDQMMKLNYRFYLNYVPEDEHKLLIEFNRAAFEFYNNIDITERKNWYIQYDFHIVDKGKLILINHKLTPLALTSDGRLWLALCLVSPASDSSPGNMEMHRVSSPFFFRYNMMTRKWNKRHMPALSDSEKSVIRLSIQGFTTSEIAEKMYLSNDTIKKYKKQIFKKLGVKNISKAVIKATNNNLI